jgi:hypothetical protein
VTLSPHSLSRSQLSRNEYLAGKVIDNIEDEPDDDELPTSLSAKANYAVL